MDAGKKGSATIDAGGAKPSEPEDSPCVGAADAGVADAGLAMDAAGAPSSDASLPDAGCR
jgi:hypothetical protein